VIEMNVRRTATALAINIALAGSATAQTREDSLAVTNAFVRKVLSEKRGVGELGQVAVVVDSGSTAWGAYAASVLRAALPRAVTAMSDTARYYALRVSLDNIWIKGAKATVWATWSMCLQNRVGRGLNWWQNPTEYELTRSDTSWVAAEGRVTMHADGHCEAYSGRP
jgi:hypothetical protein